jgi:hypothetical protein
VSFQLNFISFVKTRNGRNFREIELYLNILHNSIYKLHSLSRRVIISLSFSEWVSVFYETSLEVFFVAAGWENPEKEIYWLMQPVVLRTLSSSGDSVNMF